MLGYVVLVLVLELLGARIVRYLRKVIYFRDPRFRARTAALAAVVAEHNEMAEYVAEIRDRGLFELGESRSGEHAHLATSENTSRHRYRRDRYARTPRPAKVHHCSLHVVSSASVEPVRYVMKYFGIAADEATLARVEELGSSIGRLEEAVGNLHAREAEITASLDPPPFIRRHSMAEFLDHAGVELSPIEVPYPVYVFEYVSAGGNSGQRTRVTLDTPTIDALVEELSGRIRWRRSVAGQRALMTARLRRAIKERDGFACRQCGVALADEPHLLLEVDHIVPVSRGGLTEEANLQTLCWQCNRRKSNTMPAATAPAGPCR